MFIVGLLVVLVIGWWFTFSGDNADGIGLDTQPKGEALPDARPQGDTAASIVPQPLPGSPAAEGTAGQPAGTTGAAPQPGDPTEATPQ